MKGFRTPGKYLLLCSVVGVVLGWLPPLVHGPIPEKWDVFYVNGSVLVWAFYLDRMLIGFLVGATVWPRAWYLRGVTSAVIAMGPLGFVSLANRYCGFP